MRAMVWCRVGGKLLTFLNNDSFSAQHEQKSTIAGGRIFT
jgi:hypothetical protein